MAEAKAQLQNRVRQDPWGQPAVLIERDGLKRWVPWGDDTILSYELIAPLLDDIGLPAGPSREAVKKYLIGQIKEDAENSSIPQITIGECNLRAIDFFEGFNAGKGVEVVYS